MPNYLKVLVMMWHAFDFGWAFVIEISYVWTSFNVSFSCADPGIFVRGGGGGSSSV